MIPMLYNNDLCRKLVVFVVKKMNEKKNCYSSIPIFNTKIAWTPKRKKIFYGLDSNNKETEGLLTLTSKIRIFFL